MNKSIEEAAKAMFNRIRMNNEKCQCCKHYHGSSKNGHCDLSEYSFDNGYEYQQTRRKAYHPACPKFDLIVNN